MSRFTKESINDLPVIQNPDGSYRAMTREEKLQRGTGDKNLFGETVAPKKKEQKPQGAGFFHGMTLEEIKQKYSGGPAGIYIAGNVPSSKNNRGLMRVSKVVKQSPMMVTGSLIPSPQTQKYKTETKKEWSRLAPVFRQMIALKKPPYTISFFFIHKIQNTWDYINRTQMCQDLMAEHEWVNDDNTSQIIPDFSEGCAYDKNFPGVIIKVK